MKIEGKNPVKELLNSDVTIEKIMIADGTSDQELRVLQRQAREKGLKVEFVDKRGLDKVSETGHHQGIIAIYSEFKYADLGEVISKTKAQGKDIMFIVLDEVLDPHNLGSVIRVAECAGVSGVIIPKHRAVPVNETVAKVSAGAVSRVKVARVTNINDEIKKLKEMGVFVFVADMDGAEMYKTHLTGDIALVVGSEGFGVSKLTKKLADGVVSIPMYGKINSLNASVSAGIVVYEAVRQRKNLGK